MFPTTQFRSNRGLRIEDIPVNNAQFVTIFKCKYIFLFFFFLVRANMPHVVPDLPPIDIDGFKISNVLSYWIYFSFLPTKRINLTKKKINIQTRYLWSNALIDWWSSLLLATNVFLSQPHKWIFLSNLPTRVPSIHLLNFSPLFPPKRNDSFLRVSSKWIPVYFTHFIL